MVMFATSNQYDGRYLTPAFNFQTLFNTTNAISTPNQPLYHLSKTLNKGSLWLPLFILWGNYGKKIIPIVEQIAKEYKENLQKIYGEDFVELVLFGS